MKKQRNTALRAVTAAFALAITTGLVSITPATASPSAPANTSSRLTAGSLRIGLSSNGTVTSLVDTANGHDYASTDHPEPLIKLVADGGQQLPTAVAYDNHASTYTFTFGGKGIKVGVKAVSKDGYATLEVTSVSAPKGVDVQTLLWGPLTTTITQTIGETVGVVHDNDFAIGIHGLNDKSVGGWPTEDNNLSFPGGPSPTGKPSWPFGTFSAAQTGWGSVLQAYTYDYTKARTRNPGWDGESSITAPALTGDDAQIKGSKIALFGTAPGNVVTALSGIETGEHLIHPLVDGQWEKTSQGASQSFLVLSDLGTDTAAQASAYAKAAGIRTVYSLPGTNGPWQSNGHFQFNKHFGSSDAGATQVADTAATDGVTVGVHTLSNLVDGGDPYVAPVPDKGMATIGSVKLTRPLSATDTTAYVDGNTALKGAGGDTIWIGDEMMGFGAVTQVAGSANEYQVTLTKRGTWGTTPADHAAGDNAARLQGYDERAVAGMPILPGLSGRLAQIFNTTGLRSMSFDGLESATLTGYGTFATNRLVNGMYRDINDTDNFVSEASNLLPGTWDATTRVSWGEGSHGTPWSQVLGHQPYYQRNYMPDMMGWVTYNPTDTVRDQEWTLSQMAAWNAGAGLQTSVAALNSSGNTAGVLEAWKQWEAARNAHAFTQAQMDAMKDTNSRWHLENTVPGKAWNLYQVDYPKTALTAPDDGTTTDWDYTNINPAQSLQFELLAAKGDVANPSFTVGGRTVTYPVTVPRGDTLVVDAAGTAKVTDRTQHVVKTVTPQGSVKLAAGDQTVSYQATGATGSNAQVRIITYSAPQKLTAQVTTDAPATAAPGSANTVTASYTNPGTSTVKGVQLTPAAPKGWTAVATSHTTFATVKPGQTVTATWTITPPADAKLGDYNLPVQATYQGQQQFSPESIARITLVAPSPTATATVQDPLSNRVQSDPGA
ncbi:NEW3 domain-containing protein [Kitasatospora viridis]|uniref:Alpha-galactosidase-like protein n=1 Tax=Kitasatospora viridis TaxID=281105 RepID=A0A561TSG9_9ACTN|nr:NEW3 domain-containing protein [Kitasatospora viridis]TWF90065.1 alpha-galactosidase-like protein [Kitasatospora viridis]